jgi:hypothetical protein
LKKSQMKRSFSDERPKAPRVAQSSLPNPRRLRISSIMSGCSWSPGFWPDSPPDPKYLLPPVQTKAEKKGWNPRRLNDQGHLKDLPVERQEERVPKSPTGSVSYKCNGNSCPATRPERSARVLVQAVPIPPTRTILILVLSVREYPDQSLPQPEIIIRDKVQEMSDRVPDTKDKSPSKVNNCKR